MKRDRPRLVYSSGPGGVSETDAGSCPRCRRTPCSCAAAEGPSPNAQTVGVRREKTGRRGKTVTVAGPLVLARSAARELLRALKRECGSGGALKSAGTPDGRDAWLLEIQGDHVDPLLRRLAESGFRVRREGG